MNRIPLYYELKIAFVMYLFMPQTRVSGFNLDDRVIPQCMLGSCCIQETQNSITPSKDRISHRHDFLTYYWIKGSRHCFHLVPATPIERTRGHDRRWTAGTSICKLHWLIHVDKRTDLYTMRLLNSCTVFPCTFNLYRKYERRQQKQRHTWQKELDEQQPILWWLL